jgi:hypothetical protein
VHLISPACLCARLALSALVMVCRQDFRKQTNFLFETQRAAPKSVADSSLMLRMDFTDYFHRQAAPALWF